MIVLTVRLVVIALIWLLVSQFLNHYINIVALAYWLLHLTLLLDFIKSNSNTCSYSIIIIINMHINIDKNMFVYVVQYTNIVLMSQWYLWPQQILFIKIIFNN